MRRLTFKSVVGRLAKFGWAYPGQLCSTKVLGGHKLMQHNMGLCCMNQV